MSEDSEAPEKKKPLITPMEIALPPVVQVGKEGKAQVIQGTKDALALLQDHDLINSALTFDHLLGDPQLLKLFFNTVRDNIDLFAELIVDREGDPVIDEITETACGVTLLQVKRLLISTSAKRFFIRNDGKVVEKKYKKKIKSMVFFTKEVTMRKKVRLKDGANKFDALRRVIGFDWQLDLLEFYRDELPLAHMFALRDDVLAIRDEEQGREVAETHHENFQKIRDCIGHFFPNYLSHGAAAADGILYWRKDMIASFIRAMGEEVWDFFQREKQFFDYCTELDSARVKILGKTLVYIHKDSLIELNRLNLDRLAGTVEALHITFGDQLPMILSEKRLAVEMLRPTVDSFIHLEAKDNEQFNAACQNAIAALRDKILRFVEGIQKERAEAQAAAESEA